MTATSFDISMVPAPGLTVIEASAGTGKTFSLAALTVNAIADGRITARELCTVTFTEAATAELRSRLRRRIARGVALLDDPAVEWATKEILPNPALSRHEIQRQIKKKERAVEYLVEKYSCRELSEDAVRLACYSISDNNS